MGSRAPAVRLKPDAGIFSGDLIAWLQAYIEEKTLLPFTLLIRAGFLAMLAMRLLLRSGSSEPAIERLWWAAIAAYLVYLIGLGYYAWRNLPAFSSLRGKRIQIAVDIACFTLFYLLGGDPGSSLVFALALPLLIAARYFRVTTVLKILALVVAIVFLAQPLFYLLSDRTLVKYLPTLLIKMLVLAGITASLARSEFLNRLMYEKRRAYRRQLGLLVAQVELAQREDIAALVQTATEVARKELHAESVSLFLYQDGSFRRQKSAGIEDDWFSDESYLPGEGITGQVGVGLDGTNYGSAVVDNQVEQNPRALHSYLERYRAKLRSGKTAHLVAVPINGSNRTFGMLRAVNKLTPSGEIDREGFSLEDRDMLASIGALVAFAYSSARRDQKMRAVLEVSEALPRVFDEPQVCQKVAEAVVGLGYPLCSVLLREADDGLRVRALYAAPSAEGKALQSIQQMHDEQTRAMLVGMPEGEIDLRSARWHVVAAWMRERNFYSVLRLPLFQKERVIGILEIYGSAEHHFYPDEVRTLEVFASQVTMAIVNARLSEQNQGQFNQLKELADIISSMIALEERDALFEYVAHRAAALLHAEDCSILWANREQNTIDLKASHSIPGYMFVQKVTPIDAAPGSGLPAYVAATGEPLCFIGEAYKEHPAWDGRFLEHLAYLPSKRCASLLLYPIRDQRGAIVGVIKAENKLGAAQHEGFTRADQELLDLLTTQISIAVDKIDRIQKLRLLHESAQMITEVGEQREVLGRIAESACQVVPADLAVICPYDAERAELLLGEAVSYGQLTDVSLVAQPREHGQTRDALQSRSGYIVVEDLEREPSRSSEFTQSEGVRSFIAVALKARKVPVGILYCDFRRPRRFSPDEIRNAQAFGELAAIAIANAALFARVNRTVQELAAVQQLTKAALTNVDLDAVLETVVGVICDTLGFEMCTVSLLNDTEQVVETRAARGISDEWKRMSRHGLESRDIQAWIVRTGETAVIEGWDDRLDPVIYERFHHERLVRVFTPIYGREGIIGTVEAGYDRSAKPLITPHEVEMLRRCLEQVALVIESARLLEQARTHAVQLEKLHEMTQQMDRTFPQADIPNLLRLATDAAVMLTGPDASAAVHIYDQPSGELRLQARSGTPDERLEDLARFLGAEQPAIGSAGEPLIRSGRHEPGACWPSACVPLKSGGKTLGALCVAYHRDHWFTPHEQKILDLCAAQAATAIVNARMHRALASSLDWLLDETARSYHSMIGPHLAIVLHTVENVLAEKLGPLTPKQADRLGKAKEEIDTLTQRIERLLLLRRLEAGHVHLDRRETQLAPLIHDVVARLQPWAREKDILITCNVDRVISPLELDGEKIESIVDELLANAIKFTPPGGRVELRALQRQQRVLFWIRDNGVGIAPAHLNMIFEKYFQVTRLAETNRAGVGLGLYLARKFAELHGGRIDVRSQLGRGTTFTLTLPRNAVRKLV